MTQRRSRNWTIVQMLYRDPVEVSERHPMGWEHRSEKFVVIEGLKSRAVPIVEAWLDRDGRELYGDPHEIYYYPRNYADDFRRLTAEGRVIV